MRIRSKLPPLNTLRSFEAAARHGSFVRASEELHLTPSAISHQIRKLEDQLGVRLFDRGARDVVLSERGRNYLSVVQDAFDRLAFGTDTLLGRKSRRALRVSCEPSMAYGWLLPRLHRFLDCKDDVEVCVTTENWVNAQPPRDCDVVISTGDGRVGGLTAVPLFTDILAPVLAPCLGAIPEGFDSLRRLPVINDIRPAFGNAGTANISTSFPGANWTKWLAAADLKNLVPARVLTFDSGHAATEAAIRGFGVAIGGLRILDEALSGGTLVAPWDFVVEADEPFFAISAPGSRRERAVADFVDWLSDEAAVVRARSPQFLSRIASDKGLRLLHGGSSSTGSGCSPLFPMAGACSRSDVGLRCGN